jgi:ribosomal protein S27E
MEEPKYADKKKQSEITCTNCGAKLTFAPGTDSLKCEFCGALNKIEVKKAVVEEIDFESFINSKVDLAPKQDIVTAKCENCGAETTFDPNVVSQDCAFCAAPLIVKNGTTSSIIQPKTMLPFKVDEKAGLEKFRKWINSLWFAPNKLKKYARQKGKLAGMYIPYWTYDAATATSYSGERGDDYQETETYTNSEGKTETRTVTKTNWTYVRGNVSRDFDDVLVVASRSLPREYVDQLEPWDLTNMLEFDEKFLSGFKTERYQVDVKEGLTVAKDRMENVIEEDIRRDIGGDHQRINNKDVNYSDITFKHILLPIWLSAYQYNTKVFRFMINGRTGKVTGERPWSVWKIAFAVLAGLIVIGIIYYFANQ